MAQRKLLSAKAAVVSALAAAIVYLNSLNGDFVFDDMPAIVNNADVDPAKSRSFQLWRNNFWGQEMGSPYSQHLSYRPLTVMTFRWNVAWHGFNVFGFHLVNLLLHAACSALVVLVARRVLREHSVYAPLFAGLLFAVHPVHVEAVANIVCRAELLCCLFWCLAFLAYAAGVDTMPLSLGLRQMAAIALTGALSVCALLSKEQGITVLPACAVYDIFVASRIDLSSWLQLGGANDAESSQADTSGSTQATPKAETKSNKRPGGKASMPSKRRGAATLGLPSALVWRVVILAAVTIAVYGWRLTLNKGDDAKMDEKTNPANHIDDFVLRVLTKNYYAFLHFWLLVCPMVLCCDWSSFGVPNITGWEDPRNLSTASLYASLLIVVLFLGFSRIAPRSHRAAMLSGLGLAVLTFLPASGLLVEVGFVVAERIMYMPCLGFCIFAASALDALTRDSNKATRRMLAAIAVLALLIFSGRTMLRNPDWQSEEKLYRTGLEALPNNAKLHHNYATSITDPEAKEYHFRVAMRIYPPYASAYINLGVVQAQSGRLEEAVTVWKQGLAQWSKRPIVGEDPVILNMNIGTALKNLGKTSEAKQYLRKCLELSPQRAQCKQRLAELGGG